MPRLRLAVPPRGFLAQAYRRARAARILLCDEAPAHGVIFISDNRNGCATTQSLSAASEVDRRLLGKGPPKMLDSGAGFLLGTINGRYGAHEMCLAWEAGRVRLHVGGHSLLLMELLSWDGGGLGIDQKRLRQLASRKIRNRRSARSDRTRQQQRRAAPP